LIDRAGPLFVVGFCSCAAAYLISTGSLLARLAAKRCARSPP
jgi:hypothetical protein